MTRWGLLVLILGALLSPRAAADERLLRADPLFGRATDEGITWTVLGGTEPARIELQLSSGRQDTPGRTEVLGFGDSFPRGDLGGRWLEARPDLEQRTLQVEPGEYLECVIRGLRPGRAYRWKMTVQEMGDGDREGAALRSRELRGRFVTVRPAGSSFRFAVVADMHFFVGELGPRIPATVGSEFELDYVLRSVEWFRRTRRRIAAEYDLVASNVEADRPDFVVGLGDHFDLHGLDFNGAFSTRGQAEEAHAEARGHFSRTLRKCGALYQLIGNWEGESGDHPDEARSLAIRARRRFQVNPRPDTPGGHASPHEDYYSFQWGDVFFVALNVRGYTPNPHNLGDAGIDEGSADDYTLGPAQKAFVERELRGSQAPYKIVLIHHAIGGNAGDAQNSAYGRGGGRAAEVGEQAWLHALMQEVGVQVLFYGHDHVFTDMLVDGVHYSLPGTTGAPWRFERDVTGYEQYWTESGHGRVDVDPQRMRIEYVNFSGQVLHRFDVEPRADDD